jgi:hypothetical protein
MVGIVIGRGLSLRGLADRIRRGQPAGVGNVGLGSSGLKRGHRRHRDGVKMSERQHKLNGQRKKRQTRAMLDVQSEPLHAIGRLAPEGEDISATPVL